MLGWIGSIFTQTALQAAFRDLLVDINALLHVGGNLSASRYWVSSSSYATGYQPRHAAAILVCAAFTCLAIWLIRASWGNPHTHETRVALQSLLHTLAPTCSIWPSDYVTLARKAVSSRRHALRLPLRGLVDDIVSGRVELRISSLDLPDLLQRGLYIHGWSITLHAEWRWWIDITTWIMAAQFAPLKSSASLLTEPGTEVRRSMPRHGNSPEEVRCAQTSQYLVQDHLFIPRAFAAVLPPCIDIDTVPYTLLESSVRELQAALPSENIFTLIFTTRGVSVSVCSNAFVLAALPFLPRRQSPPKELVSSSSSYRSRWAPAPLFSSLAHVLQLLTSGPNQLTVDSVLNISEEHARSLNNYVQDLEEDRATLESSLRQLGVEGWRAERLFRSWEAACLTAKLLERWAVVVHK